MISELRQIDDNGNLKYNHDSWKKEIGSTAIIARTSITIPNYID